ncbi:hypothetical protein ASF41_12560 [Methylobacterium sp. Leaf111]|uniref:hypothetical protein n=1 Tax=Methylobacterium sp. Leaf111 TaxID=1736257 RepID=UPI0006F6E65B|nr:hypothetical protein [Methylobacterium sp. Leaf111]KQP52476.1 hypothetical protein ASF41_12560 [Methylobacterium sp. Leaf111]
MQGNVPHEGQSRSNQIHQLTGGYGQIAVDLAAEGWSPYLLVLKFRHLGGRRSSVIAQMHHEAERAYDWILTRVWKHPYAAGRQALLPRWILAPDVPVAKREKVSVRSLLPNGGLHLQGVAVMPPGSRMREGLDVHLAQESARYCPRGGCLISLHATAITRDLGYVHRYNFKALQRGRATEDEVLLLPISASERSCRPQRAAEPWQPMVLDRD